MHVAMLMDPERILAEYPMLNRLCIGMIDQGVRVTRIIPDDPMPPAIVASEQRIALAPRIEVPIPIAPWMRRNRAARVTAALERQPPDLIYAIGEQVTGLAMDIGQNLERPVVLDIWSSRVASRIPRGKSARPLAACVAATEPLLNLAAQRFDGHHVHLVPMGIPMSSDSGPGSQLPNARKNCPGMTPIAVMGTAHNDIPAYRAMLGAVRRLLDEYPDLHLFLELRGPRAHGIWQIVQQLDLLSHVSTLPDAQLYRALLTQSAVLLMPDPAGEVRTLMLEAMWQGVPIVTREDPYLDMLQEDVSALLCRAGDIEHWTRQIKRLLSDDALRTRLTSTARAMVSQHNRTTDQVMTLIECLDLAAHGGVHQFPSS